eukprot:2686329-Rhodomonas_salina.1
MGGCEWMVEEDSSTGSDWGEWGRTEVVELFAEVVDDLVQVTHVRRHPLDLNPNPQCVGQRLGRWHHISAAPPHTPSSREDNSAQDTTRSKAHVRNL